MKTGYPLPLTVLLLSSRRMSYCQHVTARARMPRRRSERRPRNHEVLLNALGGNWQIVLAVGLLALIMIPVGAWLMRQFLKLFKKRLSVRKLMNINGYARVPRLAVALVGYVIMFMNPTMFAAERPTLGLIAIIVMGFAGMIYTLFLYIYGIVVCPSEDKDVANQASEVTTRKLAEPQN
jgi:hypothetical protein